MVIDPDQSHPSSIDKPHSRVKASLISGIETGVN